MYRMILQQEQLESVIQLMQQEKICYLDTEFIRQRTRYARLALVQLNVAGEVFLIDPLTVDLTELCHALSEMEKVVFHSCNEDIILLNCYLRRSNSHTDSKRVIEHVFDTQLALEFLGYGVSMGYQSALEYFLSIYIDKQESRSNWLARPLSSKQLQYAYHDVYYLPDLTNYIRQELEKINIYQFVVEDCRHYARELVRETPAELLYLDFARSWHSPRQLAQLQQLTAWREQCSIEMDLLPSFVLKNDEICKLVAKQPKDEYEVAQLVKKYPSSPFSYATILKLLYKLPAKKSYPQRVEKVHFVSPQKIPDIEQMIKETATRYHLPASCLMRKKWLNDLYAFEPTLHEIDTLPDFLLGWRYDIITRPILQHLYGETIGK